MKRRKRRSDADERPSRKKQALRHIEDREWEEELRYAEHEILDDDELLAWPSDDVPDESDWAP